MTTQKNSNSKTKGSTYSSLHTTDTSDTTLGHREHLSLRQRRTSLPVTNLRDITQAFVLTRLRVAAETV